MQNNFKILVTALSLLLASGCSKPPSDADIGMGEKSAQPATEARPAAASASSAVLVPVLLAAGEGKTTRVITTCNVEQVNGQSFGASSMELSKSAPATFNGWVIDQKGASDDVQLRLINSADATTYAVTLKPDVARDDVVKAFGGDAVSLKPGFNAKINTKDMANGDYHLQLVVESSANGAAACDNGRAISIVN